MRKDTGQTIHYPSVFKVDDQNLFGRNRKAWSPTGCLTAGINLSDLRPLLPVVAVQ